MRHVPSSFTDLSCLLPSSSFFSLHKEGTFALLVLPFAPQCFLPLHPFTAPALNNSHAHAPARCLSASVYLPACLFPLMPSESLIMGFFWAFFSVLFYSCMQRSLWCFKFKLSSSPVGRCCTILFACILSVFSWWGSISRRNNPSRNDHFSCLSTCQSVSLLWPSALRDFVCSHFLIFFSVQPDWTLNKRFNGAAHSSVGSYVPLISQCIFEAVH